MKKVLFSFLILALLLPTLASCKSDSDGTDGTSELRPVQTYTPDHLYMGTFIDYPDDLTIYPDWEQFVCNNRIYIRVNENLVQPDEYGRVRRPSFLVVSPEDGTSETVPIPAGAVPEDGMNRTHITACALSENRLAIVDRNYTLDDGTGAFAASEWLLSVFDESGNRLWSMPAEPLVERQIHPVTGHDYEYMFTVSALHFDPNGTLYMVTEYSVLAFSPTGEKLYETGEGIYINGHYRTADGRLLVQYTDVAEGKKLLAGASAAAGYTERHCAGHRFRRRVYGSDGKSGGKRGVRGSEHVPECGHRLPGGSALQRAGAV